jgi:hypothetical protein
MRQAGPDVNGPVVFLLVLLHLTIVPLNHPLLLFFHFCLLLPLLLSPLEHLVYFTEFQKEKESQRRWLNQEQSAWVLHRGLDSLSHPTPSSV